MMANCGEDLHSLWGHYFCREKEDLLHDRVFMINIVQMLRHIIKAIIKLHKVGYLHNDLKLDNICYKAEPGSKSRSGQAKGTYFLIDYGTSSLISKSLVNNDSNKSILGN